MRIPPVVAVCRCPWKSLSDSSWTFTSLEALDFGLAAAEGASARAASAARRRRR
jgi:hypothetical protein